MDIISAIKLPYNDSEIPNFGMGNGYLYSKSLNEKIMCGDMINVSHSSVDDWVVRHDYWCNEETENE